MAINGQACKQDFLILSSLDTKKIIETAEEMQGCCFPPLPALAEITVSDPLKNDSHSVIFFFNKLFSGADFYLQKNENGIYVDVDDLDSNSYGVLYDFGFFENKFKEKAIGYKIDWQKVLIMQGEGDYRIKCTASPNVGPEFDQFSFEFCLETWTAHRADNTTRFSFWRNGQYGDPFFDTKLQDFGTINWFNQIRLPNSIFGFETSEFSRENIKYQSGNVVWVEDSQTQKFQFTAEQYPEFLHRFIRTSILPSDTITISDYNSQNPTTHVDRGVRCTSNYEPSWVRGAKFASVVLSFESDFQNLVHFRD